jgi:hypothetical protein
MSKDPHAVTLVNMFYQVEKPEYKPYQKILLKQRFLKNKQ